MKDLIKELIDDYMQAKYIALLIVVAVVAFLVGTKFPGQLTEAELIAQLDSLQKEQRANNPSKDPFFAKAKGKW